MVTTLYLVRHGAIEGAGIKRYHGSIDVPLSEEGIEQIKGAAKFIVRHAVNDSATRYQSYLRDAQDPKDKILNMGAGCVSGNAARLTAVYSSDLQRAVRSAEIIAEPYNLIPLQVPALRERSFGIWEGMTFSEIKEKYPSEFEAWAGNPLKYSPVGGESTIAVDERVRRVLEDILCRHENECIAIVSHGGVNRVILCYALGMPLKNIFRIEQDYAAVNIIEFWDRYPVVKLLNGGIRK